MHWNKNNYPASMKHLTAEVRAKATEIANDLLEAGFAEGRAIAVGISRAVQWAENRGRPVRVTSETKEQTAP